jgi:sigma-B regulation protein RsbU (phosphoserine phosphatase)
MNADMDLFSEPRLHETLKKNKDRPPRELLAAVKQEIDIFADGAEQADDITMLALEIDHYSEAVQSIGPVMNEFIFEACNEKLNEVISFVNSQLERNNCPVELQSQIDIAVEEIFVNIAKYAYAPGSGNVLIGIAVGKAAVIKFEDSGLPYNPLEHIAPDLDKPLEERKVGGLGIFFVKQIMDTLTYKRTDNKNILTMTKKIS